MMKIVALLAVLAVSTTSAALCNITALAPLLTDTDLTGCSSKAGLTLPPKEAITEATLMKACGTKECISLLGKVEALKLGDCSIGTFMIESGLINPLKKACAAAPATTAPAGGASSTAGSMSSANEVTTAPAATTAAPAADASSSGSADAAETMAPSSSVPAPAPTSGAAVMNVAAAASVVAVAAAMW